MKNNKEYRPRNMRCVRFKGWVSTNEYTGVVLKSIDISHKYPNSPYVYVVCVFTVDGRKLSQPYLKWINSSYCTEIKNYTINSKFKDYLNYERMIDHGKKKTKKRK